MALDAAGELVARRQHLVAEPLWITAPAVVPRGLVTTVWGTALSAPRAMNVALALVTLRTETGSSARSLIRALGALRLAGVLAEPATWGRRRPRWAAGLSPCHVALALALLRAGSAPPSGRRLPS